MIWPWQWKRRALAAEARLDGMHRMVYGNPGLLELAGRAMQERTEAKLAARRES